MANKPTDIVGYLVTENKTFYYLETGIIKIINPLDRVMKILLARDIITYDGTKEDIAETKYKAMTLHEAKEKGYKVEILYLNSHIKTNAVSITTPDNKKISWGKK